jgi:hypothetical protein
VTADSPLILACPGLPEPPPVEPPPGREAHRFGVGADATRPRTAPRPA